MFPSHVGLSSGPFDSCACLWLARNLYLGSYLLVSYIFGSNLPTHIFRPAYVEFVNKSSYANIYSLWCLYFSQYLIVRIDQNRPSTPSRCRCGLLSIDVIVVVELTSRIQDLPYNESYELLTHGINPIGIIVNFIQDLTHLSFWKKKVNILINRVTIIRKNVVVNGLYILLDSPQ